MSVTRACAVRAPVHGRGFTLIELLVSIGVIALLISILLPSLAGSRRAARSLVCAVNLRSLQLAHAAYLVDSDGMMLGTSHGSSWRDVLRTYDAALLLRCPDDDSPHFEPDDPDEPGRPVDGVYRQASYALNYELSPDNPTGTARIDAVPFPSATIHGVPLVREGSSAAGDHVHPRLWLSANPAFIPRKAATEIQTDDHGGEALSWMALANYGYLDGHAESSAFQDVYTDRAHNRFMPAVAR